MSEKKDFALYEGITIVFIVEITGGNCVEKKENMVKDTDTDNICWNFQCTIRYEGCVCRGNYRQ